MKLQAASPVRAALLCALLVPGLNPATTQAASPADAQAASQASGQPDAPTNTQPDAPEPPNLTQTPTLHPTYTTTAPRVDGHLDDAVWREADLATGFIQQRPTSGAPSTAVTTVRVIYTPDALYIGFECAEPVEVLARSLGRDADLADEDHFALLIDTFNDNQNGYAFSINPNGTRTDWLVRSEGEQLNFDWDGIWQAQARVTADGWQGEIRIPWNTLRFPRGDRLDMGLNFRRNRRVPNEQSFWAPVPRQYTLSRPSLAGSMVGLTGIDPGRNLQVRPYALGRVERGELGDPDVWADDDWDPDGEIGLDVKLGLSSELTLDLTVNPDFAQVEIDDELVNLTRFPLFFPEKREFFLEKANLFSFGPGYNQLFYSRRIGLDDVGETLPIYYGARLTGKIGSTEIGALDMVQGGARGVPQRRFDVVRLKQDVGRSSIGGIYARRGTENNLEPVNTSFGIDADLFPTDNLLVSGYAAMSDEDGAGKDDLTAGARARWSSPLFVFTASHEIIGSDYDPAIGFVERNGVNQTGLGWEHTPEPNWKWIRRFENQGFFYWIDRRHQGFESRYIHVNPVVVGQSEQRIGVFFEQDFDRLYDPFPLGDPTDPESVVFPTGDYTYSYFGLNAETDPSQWWAISFRGTFGEFFDGNQTLLDFSARLQRVPHWTVAAEYEQARIDRDGPTQQQQFESDVVRLRLAWDLNNAFGIDLFTQLNTTNDIVVSQLRAHYLFGDESDIYFVVTDGRGDSSLDWAARSSEITLKVSYVMQL